MAESSYGPPEASFSQEMSFQADTEPLWMEALQLALIYDLTDGPEKSPPTPTHNPGQPPSQERRPQGA